MDGVLHPGPSEMGNLRLWLKNDWPSIFIFGLNKKPAGERARNLAITNVSYQTRGHIPWDATPFTGTVATIRWFLHCRWCSTGATSTFTGSGSGPGEMANGKMWLRSSALLGAQGDFFWLVGQDVMKPGWSYYIHVPRTQMTHILEDLTRKMEGQPLKREGSWALGVYR